MSQNYLDDLPLSAESKEKIAQLGLPNAAALLAMIRTIPKDFADFLHQEEMGQLTAALESHLSASEHTILETPIPKFHATGAIIEMQAPALKSPHYDLTKRDRLFARLQNLRRKPNPSLQTKQRIALLEQTLNDLLEGTLP